MRHLLPIALLAAVAAPAAAQQPVFTPGDAGHLKVKVSKVEDSIDGLASALVTVTVANPTDSWAEPTEFLFKVKGVKDVKVQRAPRVEAPFHGRAGRAIPPQGKLDYVLAVPLEPKQVNKNGAEVLQASFFDGGALEEPPVEVGDIDEAASEQDLQGTVIRFSRVELKNTSPHVVDVVLRADFKQPRDGEALVRFRLQPHEQRRCTVEGPMLRFNGYADLRGSDLKSVELVDWSALRAGDEDPGRELLRAAFDAQARWPRKQFRYEAEYEVLVETWDWNARERVKYREEGRCTSEDGFATFMTGEGEQTQTGILGSMVLQEANFHLRDPDFESFLDGGTPVLHAVEGEFTIVGVTYPAGRASLDRWYWIADGLIVAQAHYPFAGEQRIYEREMVGGASAVKSVLHRDIAYGPSDWDNTLEVVHREVDGVVLPVEVKRARRFNPEENNEYVTVKLKQLRVLGAPRDPGVKPVPEGALADEVRAAWERAYRYDKLPVDLHGKFRMTNGGNDLVWQGVEEVSGTFHIVGFTGLGITDAKITLDGDLREELAYQLADVARDRFGMYMGRDLCGRKSFDEQFAGARFEKQGARIVVHDNLISGLEIRNGRLAVVELMTDRRLTWKKVDGVDLLTRAEMNAKERIEYDRELVDGLWLPVEVRMYDVFEDWGPEMVFLSELRVAPNTAQ